MIREPLFIRYANGKETPSDIIQSFIRESNHDKSKDIAKQAIDDIPDLSVFRKDFRSAIKDLIDNGISNYIINYINSYMKPSLEEVVEGGGSNRLGEKRWINIKEADTPWIEAVVCYNLTLYIKSRGYQEIKLCPVCDRFFTNKGKYAKYCSESCKSKGSN